MPKIDCEICGNPIDAGTPVCPFCQQPQQSGGIAQVGRATGLSERYPTCSIKDGQPFVADAEQRLRREVDTAHTSGARVLTVIHGYGSTGQGGAIRDAARQLLRGLETTRTIQGSVHGEDFGPATSEGASLARQFPRLREHRDWGNGNPGITLVIL